MSLCNATKQELIAEGLNPVTGKCPVEGCGLPVARHRDENAPPQAGKYRFPMMCDVLRKELLLT